MKTLRKFFNNKLVESTSSRTVPVFTAAFRYHTAVPLSSADDFMM